MLTVVLSQWCRVMSTMVRNKIKQMYENVELIRDNMSLLRIEVGCEKDSLKTFFLHSLIGLNLVSYYTLYNDQIDAHALIGQSEVSMVYRHNKSLGMLKENSKNS